MSTAVLEEPTTESRSHIASNYRIGGGHAVVIRGEIYPEGSVLPEWAANHDGGLPGRIANKVMVPTSERSNCNVQMPPPKTEVDVAPQIEAEMIRLQRENIELAADNKTLSEQYAALLAQDAGRVRSLAELTDQANHWRTVAETAQARVAELEAEKNLEATNKTPVAEAKPDPKPKAAGKMNPSVTPGTPR